MWKWFIQSLSWLLLLLKIDFTIINLKYLTVIN
jgi:hypothetical protein